MIVVVSMIPPAMTTLHSGYRTPPLKTRMYSTTAGPRTATYRAGKRKKTSGNTSLTPIFPAFSSALCRRLTLEVSAWVRNACAMLVPNRSVWISIADNARTSSTFVRAAKFLNASSRGFAGRGFCRDEPQLFRQRWVRDLELIARLDDGLVDARPRLDAHDQQVQRIG